MAKGETTKIKMSDEILILEAKRMRPMADAFLKDHPQHWDGIERATYAYHLNHRERSDAHYFSGSRMESECRWCGRSRQAVRWDQHHPRCSKRPAWANETIQSVIAREEVLYERVWALALEIARQIDPSTLTGETLSILHHTHGIDPSMLECALIENGRALPQHLHDAYLGVYKLHRETGRHGQKREIIVAKTTDGAPPL